MAIELACVDVQVLKQLVEGRLSGQEVAALEEHLLGCDRCAGTVNVLVTQDTLAEALQAQRSAGEPENDLVRGLIERLRGLRTTTTDSGLTSADQQDSS